MNLVETIVLREPWEAKQRLAELRLDLILLLKIRDIALSAAADATPFHALSAGGTFSYHAGTWALRDNFIGDKWKINRFEGVESIINGEYTVRVVFANVDIACNDEHIPNPRSKKGAGSERACSGNLSLFPNLPIPVKPGMATYYLMVAENGACELTRPIIERGTFVLCIERIYLSDGSDFDPTLPKFDTSDIQDNFDPQVVRK